MAKKKKVRPLRQLTKKQRTRAEREARMTRRIIAGTIAVIALVLVFLALGYWAEARQAREPVAVVNGVPINTADFAARVRQRRIEMQQELRNYRGLQMGMDPTDPAVASLLEQLNQRIRDLETQLLPEYAAFLGGQILDEMVQGELIRKEADRRGITVSQEEIDRAIELRFGYDRDAAEEEEESTPPVTGPLTGTQPVTPTDSMTREEFEQRRQDYVASVLRPSGLGEEGYHALVEVSLLYEKVREAIVATAPTVADQVQVRYVAFPAQEEAGQMVERLDAEEAWEDIIAEIEADESSSAYASEPGWQTEILFAEQFGAEIGQMIFEAPVGTYTQPLLGISGSYHVLQVMGHEQRELDPLLLGYEQNRVFEEWLTGQMQSVERSENWQEKVPTEP